MDYSQHIIVTSDPHFDPVQSDVQHQKFVWSYQISITNNSQDTIQLLHRYWRIADMAGKVEEVHGAGVVGLQPLIKPGKHFMYTSYCQLATPHGTMEGRYEMQNLDELHFFVAIPRFVLAAPMTVAASQDYRSKLH